MQTTHGSRKFCQRGSNFYMFFLNRCGEREGPNTTKSGPSSACWHANDGPTLNADLVALWIIRGSGPVLLRNHIFCDFSGRGSGHLFPPLAPPMHTVHNRLYASGSYIWVTSWQNQQSRLCAQQKLRSDWAYAWSGQSSLSVWMGANPFSTSTRPLLYAYWVATTYHFVG